MCGPPQTAEDVRECFEDLTIYLDALFNWRSDFAIDDCAEVVMRPKLVFHMEASVPLAVDVVAEDVKGKWR